MNQIIYAGKHILTYLVARHSHTSWELIYCTSGAGRLVFDEFSLPYQTGDVVVIPPFVPHFNESSEGFTNIHLNMQDLSLPLKQPALYSGDPNQMLYNAFSGAFFQFGSSRGRNTPLLSAYGHLIVCHLLELQEAKPYSAVVEEIESAIVNNYPDCGFELDAYLRGLPFSYDYVRKLFKKGTGITPHQYLNDLRLQVAAQYLAYSGQGGPNVTEVAHLCGFREALYFSRMFKKKYGLSPSAYVNAVHNGERVPAPDVKSIMARSDA